MRPVIVTVAPTGGMLRSSAHPHVPTQPDDIVADVLRCADAGASVAALHVRTPDEAATCDPELYARVNAGIRAATPDLILNNSSGGGISGAMRSPLGPDMHEVSWEQRLAAPHPSADTVTLDAITAWASVDGDEVLMNTPPSRARELGRRILDLGLKPEWEAFSPAHAIVEVPRLIRDLGAEGSPIVNICVGLDGVFTNAVPWSPRIVELMVDALPVDAVVSLTVGGSTPWPALAHALALGCHIRVGLEDHPWHADGAAASNLELVERAVTLVETLGHRPATPAEARDLLGLDSRSAA